MRRGAGEVVIAPIDVILDADRPLVLRPDLLFISKDRADIVRERIYGAPDLAIEVLSPHPRIGQLDERIQWFAEYGVREIWLYQQITKRLDVLTCRDGAVDARTSFERHDPIRSSVLPEFRRSMASMLAVW